ncbi:Aldehyde dehydrogenase family 3 member I1, chloroplastic [Linum perenne]
MIASPAVFRSTVAGLCFPPLSNPLPACASAGNGRILISGQHKYDTSSSAGRRINRIFICKCSVTVPPVLREGEQNPPMQTATFGSKEATSLVKKLRQSFNTGKTKTFEWRISQLNGISKMVQERENDIVSALYEDLSKPPLEAFVAEISMARAACKEAIEGLKDWMKPEKVKTTISTFPSSAEIVPEPLGVVLVISTWNFPFLLSIDPVIAAIAAGNAVVLKPSEIAPATSSLLSKLLPEYLDESAVTVIEGAIPETTALLEQQWDKILYTGSAKVGRIVMAAAAKHLTPVVLELGGKCPAVVDSNVDLEVAVRRIIAGKWQCNNGQACIGVDYIITTKDFAPKLIEGLKKGIEEFFGKDAMESKDISRIVSMTQFKRLVGLLEEDNVSDKIVLGGRWDADRLKIAPTIVLDPPQDSQMMQEEIFGPILPIVTVENLRDSFGVINSKPKPLAAYLFTDDEQLKQDFVQNVPSGGMSINDTILHVTVHTLPFGGVGESGMGSYHGKYSFDAFSHKKSVLYRSWTGDASLRYPPYTKQKQSMMKGLMNGGLPGLLSAWLGSSSNE